jgi:lactoylglutathione lyase
MIRVSNLEKSLTFYTNILGMKLLRRHEYPDGKFTLAFVGFGDEKNHAASLLIIGVLQHMIKVTLLGISQLKLKMHIKLAS